VIGGTPVRKKARISAKPPSDNSEQADLRVRGRKERSLRASPSPDTPPTGALKASLILYQTRPTCLEPLKAAQKAVIA